MEKARRLKALSARTGELAAAIGKGISALSDDAVSQLNGQVAAVLAAETALSLAAQTDLQAEPLVAGNSSEWRLLYEAAREYSTKVAYPNADFPAAHPGGLCVLCQQPLSGDARDRMQRFKKFMEDKTEETLRDAQEVLKGRVSSLRTLVIPDAEDCADVLGELSAQKREQLTTLMDRLRSEQKRLTSAGSNLETIECSAEFQDPISTLTELKESLATSAAQAEKDADPATLKQLETVRDDLVSRKALNQSKLALQQYVELKGRQFLYEDYVHRLSTRFISEKSKEIIGATLSPQLRKDLKEEIARLGAAHLPLNVNITGREGGASVVSHFTSPVVSLFVPQDRAVDFPV